MTGSSMDGRSSDVAGKSILNHAHHTTGSSIPNNPGARDFKLDSSGFEE